MQELKPHRNVWKKSKHVHRLELCHYKSKKRDLSANMAMSSLEFVLDFITTQDLLFIFSPLL